MKYLRSDITCYCSTKCLHSDWLKFSCCDAKQLFSSFVTIWGITLNIGKVLNFFSPLKTNIICHCILQGFLCFSWNETHSPLKLNNINVDMLVESLMINVVIKAVEYCRGNLFWFGEDQLQAGVPEFSFEKCLLDGEQSKGVTTQPKFNGWKFKIFWNFYESNIGIIMQYISTGQIQHWSFACIHKTLKKR